MELLWEALCLLENAWINLQHLKDSLHSLILKNQLLKDEPWVTQSTTSQINPTVILKIHHLLEAPNLWSRMGSFSNLMERGISKSLLSNLNSWRTTHRLDLTPSKTLVDPLTFLSLKRLLESITLTKLGQSYSLKIREFTNGISLLERKTILRSHNDMIPWLEMHRVLWAREKNEEWEMRPLQGKVCNLLYLPKQCTSISFEYKYI